VKIAYSASTYGSFDRAAQDYRTCLRRLGEPVVDDYVAVADLVALHGEPRQIPDIFQKLPELRRHRVVGYVVWEHLTIPHPAPLPALTH